MFLDTRVEGKTDRYTHADRNTLNPIWGRSNNRTKLRQIEVHLTLAFTRLKAGLPHTLFSRLWQSPLKIGPHVRNADTQADRRRQTDAATLYI